MRFVQLTLLTTLTLLAGFYFFILKPKLELPNALLSAEEILSTNELNLLQNRLSLLGLVNLDVSNPNVGAEKELLIAKLVESNKIGLESISKFPAIKGLNDFPDLLTENKEILERQKVLVEKLAALGDANKNIFLYNPETDLGSLNPTEEKEIILERSSAAVNGLENIKGNFKENDGLISKITETQVLLNELNAQTQAGNVLESGRLFDQISQSFLEMRQIGLKMETDLIKSPEIVQLITDQTNLMLKYDFWLDKIDAEQTKLLDRNLYGF